MTSPRGRRRTSGPPRVRRRVVALGIVLVLVGVGCLGWVGYQYVGSNLLAERTFATETGGLRAQWRADPTPGGSSGGSSGGSAGGSSTGGPAAAVEPGASVALLRVPRFGSAYEVPVVEGVAPGDLTRGVGHFPGTAEPGQPGNFAVAGHRVTHGEPFRRLLELDRGDQIVVETRTAVYTYVLQTAPRDLTVDASAGWAVGADPSWPGRTDTAGGPLITLTTCQELFRSPRRSVAFGTLAETRTK